jgi:paraquat-inducible protein A
VVGASLSWCRSLDVSHELGLSGLFALVVYPAGVLLPALRVERVGRCHESSIAGGCLALLREGDLFLCLVVGLSALVLPPVKLACLLWLAQAGPEHRRRAPRWLGWLNRFGCIEIYLVAFFVGLVRLGAVVRFEARPGLYLFTLSVLSGLAASALLAGSPDRMERLP